MVVVDVYAIGGVFTKNANNEYYYSLSFASDTEAN